MSGAAFLDFAITASLALLTASLVLVTVRIARGPSLPDRILGLDMLVSVGIGYIAVFAIKTGFMLYLDVAISLGLVGFLATVAFARFVLQRWHIRTGQSGQPASREAME
jgi:multicomponent Na+:H+ antiporter subunit F